MLIPKRHPVRLALVLLCLSPAAAFAAAPPEEPTSEIYDYLVQNVCVDDQGKALRISPLDDKCARQRNLRLGEGLPYHKHDWAGVKAKGEAADLGHQRDDTVPVFYPGVGYFVLGTLDFGDGQRKFGVYDGDKGDGLSLISIQGDYAGSVMTFDHHAGVQLFTNPDHCRGKVDIDSLIGGWVYAPVDLARNPAGMLNSSIKRVPAFGVACPPARRNQTTKWYLRDYAPMTGTDTPGSKKFRTLISEHFSGKDSKKFAHLERMYFTRELGRIRWERWQNLSQQAREGDEESADMLESSGRCSGGVGPPDFPGKWTMVRCHEWSNLIPTTSAEGDHLDTWFRALTNATRAGPLLNVKMR